MDVVIIGGGLAGLAAAVRLAPAGYRVTILEARNRLGGRASSFIDPASGELVDACQHVSMGCCTAYKQFCETIGVDHFLEPQPTLYFMTPDRRVSRFKRDPWPAPFHLGRALASAHYLSMTDKLRIGYGMLQLWRMKPDDDPPLLPWLRKHYQSQTCIDRFWRVVLTSALNESVENLGLKYARKVFVDAFLTDRDGFVVEIPKVPLGRLYGEELNAWLRKCDVKVRLNAAVKAVSSLTPDSYSLTPARDDVEQGSGFRNQESGKNVKIEFRDGSVLNTDAVIVTVPFERVNDMISGINISLQPSPITSVHFWFDRDGIDYPHVTLIDCLGQWVFRRGPGYLQVVVSASDELKVLGREEIERRVRLELLQLFPKLQDARLLRSKVITEHAATFRAVPGVDALRPPQRTSMPGVYLAGDYTQTGWPATMEGAVRSGTLAAEAIIHDFSFPRSAWERLSTAPR